ncbi:MAG TPA: MFS transporter [Magnetospirillaceae bacterium]
MTTRTPAQLATYLSFFAAGFGLACWAPLVPFAKARTGVDDGELGLLLLCLGIGSIVTMPLTGWLSTRWGTKPIAIGGGIGLALMLPLLSVADTPALLAAVLLLFGASLGTLDVAMNIHAVEVERQLGRPLMSGFHGMFSIGGFAGSGGMTVLLSNAMPPSLAALAGGVLTLVAIILAWPRLLTARGEPTKFVLPRGIVLLLALLCAITFLVEGSLLDWSALLVIDRGLADATHGGFGYMLFAIAMTVGRVTGDRVVAWAGNRRVLIWGGVLAVAGFAVLLTASLNVIALAGFLLIGLGASNLVPVLVRLAGRQTVMPAGLAVAAITVTGYAGILAGPAGVGFVSRTFDLPTAFWALAGLMSLVPLLARPVTRSDG